MKAKRGATAAGGTDAMPLVGSEASASLGQGPHAPAPRRWTSATLTGGVIVSAVSFLIAGAAELFGADIGGGEMTDVGALASGLVDLSPWAWASLGTIVVVVTPALGLLATAYEYASVADRRTVLLALAVLGILILSAIIAALR